MVTCAPGHSINQVTGKWINWSLFMESSPTFPSNVSLDSVIVPTADTVRYNYHVDSAIAMRRHVLLVGPTGTGKSAYVRSRLNALSSGTGRLSFERRTVDTNGMPHSGLQSRLSTARSLRLEDASRPMSSASDVDLYVHCELRTVRCA